MYSQRTFNEREIERVPVTQTKSFKFRGFQVTEVKTLDDNYLIDDTNYLVVYESRAAVGRHEKVEGLKHFKSLRLRHDREHASELLRYLFSGLRLKPKNKYYMQIDCGLVDVERLFHYTDQRMDYDILFPQYRIIHELKNITNNHLELDAGWKIYDSVSVLEYLRKKETHVLITLDQLEIDEEGTRYMDLTKDIEVAVTYNGRLELYLFDSRTAVFKKKEILTKNSTP